MPDPTSEFIAADKAFNDAKEELKRLGKTLATVGDALEKTPGALRTLNSAHAMSAEGGMPIDEPVRIDPHQWPTYERLEQAINLYFRAEQMKAAKWKALPQETRDYLRRK